MPTKKWAEKHQQFAAFAAAALLFLLLHALAGVAEFRYDAWVYWDLSAKLFDYPRDHVRGYFFPAVLAAPKWLSDKAGNLIPYRILSSLFYAGALAILLPNFYESVFGGRLSFWRRLIPSTLVAALFPGLILYPLSDLPAIVLVLAALFCAIKSAGQPLLLIPAGALAYGAYNTRTVYLFSAILIAALVAMIRSAARARARALALILFLFGMAVTAVPQSLINLKNHNTLWPGVISTVKLERGLFVSHLLWGITIQRYETSLDKNPAGSLFYIDTAGGRLFLEEQIGQRPFSLAAYLKLVLTHPIEFAGIYGRHAVNGLDVRDGIVYTSTLSKDKNWLAVVNFLIVFVGLGITAAARREMFKARTQWISAAVVLLPVLLAIPGAVETRFFFPLHLALYSVLAFSGDAAVLKTLIRPRVLIVAAIVGLLFLSITTATMGSLQFEFPELYRIRDAAEGATKETSKWTDKGRSAASTGLLLFKGRRSG